MRIKIKTNDKTLAKIHKSIMEKSPLYNMIIKYDNQCKTIDIPNIPEKWHKYIETTRDLIEGLIDDKNYYEKLYIKNKNKHIHFNVIMIIRVIEQYLLLHYFTDILENDPYYRNLALKTRLLTYNSSIY